ncbi:lipid II flippase MurJ [uncultured Sphingomonas sp.]|uniref:lipid II flippase MurJ n=1 Tax=uncultured Sphingomonas sp. TaxID=158754 RepID=UPI0025D18AD3|nr:lipid II flippase MurJ [uncultured Sphingomonas sp.]
MLTRVGHLLFRSTTLRVFGMVVMLAGAAKVVGLVKEMAVAARFGTGPALDAYLFIFNILSTPASMWFSTISAVLVPQLIAWQRNAPEEASRFRSEFLSFAIVAGVVAGLLGLIGLYGFIASGMSGLDGAASRHALTVLPYLWLMVPLLFVAQYGASCLMARNLHANSLYEGAPALIILIALLVLPASIRTLSIATVLGFGLQLAATFISLARCGSLARPMVGFRSSVWIGLWSSLLAMACVQFLQSAVSVVDQIIAAQLPAGSLSRFGYALRAQGLVLTLLALAVPRVLLPALASMSHAGPEELKRFVNRWAMLLIVAGGATAAITALLSEPVIAMLFERGSFSAADTKTVSTLLAVMIWQLPFYLLTMLYAQRQIVARDFTSLIATAVGTLVVKLTVGMALVWKFGLVGLTASIPIVAAFQVMCLVYLGRKAGRRPIPAKS